MKIEDLVPLKNKLRVDLNGEKFNRLSVIKLMGKNKHDKVCWLCQCDCGNEIIVISGHLKSGNTKSCGCLQIEAVKKTATIHGLSKTPVYLTWENIKRRCYDKNSKDYKFYGVRGIIVCDRWLNKEDGFINFYKDMGKRPSKEYSIDRIDNNGNYEPNNCKWSTQREQCRNRKSNHIITYKGKTQCLTDWAEELNMNRKSLSSRLNRQKWSVEKAFTTKIKNKEL